MRASLLLCLRRLRHEHYFSTSHPLESRGKLLLQLTQRQADEFLVAFKSDLRPHSFRHRFTQSDECLRRNENVNLVSLSCLPKASPTAPLITGSCV